MNSRQASLWLSVRLRGHQTILFRRVRAGGHSAKGSPAANSFADINKKLMRHNKLSLFVHLIWSTWDRVPLIDEEVERRLYRFLHHQAGEQECKVLAIGGVEDHVHLLLEFPPTHAISNLVKNIKGPSSLFANNELGFDGSFKWQASYAAFSVSRWDLTRVRKYIECQKEHHQNGTTKPALELGEITEVFVDEM